MFSDPVEEVISYEFTDIDIDADACLIEVHNENQSITIEETGTYDIAISGCEDDLYNGMFVREGHEDEYF